MRFRYLKAILAWVASNVKIEVAREDFTEHGAPGQSWLYISAEFTPLIILELSIRIPARKSKS